jgi:NAD(P)-dependent dehydrogenase (short-subunit alcohol dehydrogenase family)
VTSTHALVIGGSGMLAGVVHELAARGWDVTLVARGRERLERVAERAPDPSRVHPVALDYRDGDALLAAVRGAQEARGHVGAVVAWIHGTAPGAHELVAREVGRHPPRCRYLELLGSASRDPAAIAPERLAEFAALPCLDPCRVLLGFRLDGGSARWLTDSEICHGTIAALDSGQSLHVVGTLEPWSARP